MSNEPEESSVPAEVQEEEILNEPSEVEANEETAPEPDKPKEIKPIPYERFKEVWEDKQQAKHEAEQLRYQNAALHEAVLKSQMIQLQQQQQQRSVPIAKPRTREEQELAEILDPFIKEAIKPLVQDYQQKAQALENLVAHQKVQEAENYVMTNVPDFKELAPDLQSWLQTQTPGYRDFITSHPDNVVLACNMIRAQRQAGGGRIAAKVRNDLKSRASSETGGSHQRETGNLNNDYNSMSAEEFAKRDAEIMRRKGMF